MNDIFASHTNEFPQISNEHDNRIFAVWLFTWAGLCTGISEEKSVDDCREFLLCQNIQILDNRLREACLKAATHQDLVQWLGLCENCERMKFGYPLRPIVFELQMRRWSGIYQIV
eukprot:GHVH01006321.1.p3 GENE.GHVH01006321.1~~GHVH01006321.1.p3  ORF type:complete len:123 (+),score=13.61 GHVH01006321.1:25-369(+)